MMLITPEQGNRHLRLDYDLTVPALLEELTEAIEEASLAVMNYIQGPGIDGFTDSAGDWFEDSNGYAENVPTAVRAATKLMLGYLWRYRDENPDKEFERGYLPAPVTALLTPYRDPSVA